MKKLFALLLALVMLFALSATAMAEEAKGSDDTASVPKTLSWFTARRGIQQAELSGEFYQIQDLDIDIWVPDLLQPVEEVSENTFCAFEAENKGAVISVNHLTFDGQPTLEEVEKMAVDQGSVSDGMFWINGFDTLVLETKSEDSLSVIIMITDGGAMEFAFAPISNPDVYSMASLVMATIKPAELTEKQRSQWQEAQEYYHRFYQCCEDKLSKGIEMEINEDLTGIREISKY